MEVQLGRYQEEGRMSMVINHPQIARKMDEFIAAGFVDRFHRLGVTSVTQEDVLAALNGEDQTETRTPAPAAASGSAPAPPKASPAAARRARRSRRDGGTPNPANVERGNRAWKTRQDNAAAKAAESNGEVTAEPDATPTAQASVDTPAPAAQNRGGRRRAARPGGPLPELPANPTRGEKAWHTKLSSYMITHPFETMDEARKNCMKPMADGRSKAARGRNGRKSARRTGRSNRRTNVDRSTGTHAQAAQAG
jgi:hypothetical protein